VTYPGAPDALGHLLFILVAVFIPLQSWAGVRRLRADPDAFRDRHSLYLSGMLVQWLLCIGAFAVIRPPAALWRLAAHEDHQRAILATPAGWLFLLIALCLGVWLLLPFVPSPWREGQRAWLGERLRELAFLMPETPNERRLWWLVSVTAGITEECVYRGFLLRYLAAPPWNLHAPVAALLFASLIFGLAHAYQGAGGIAVTALMGLALGVTFVATGTLLAPILLHTLIDLRILLLWPAPGPSGRDLEPDA
jgi:membrane protease YdiL (CAAX protease family)